MPPKTDSKNTTVERPYGLSEGEMVFAIHACKLLIQEGKVERASLCEVTGRDNQETVKRMWSTIKKKMGVNTVRGADDQTPVKSATPKAALKATPKATPKSSAKATPKRTPKRKAEETPTKKGSSVKRVKQDPEMKDDDDSSHDDKDIEFEDVQIDDVEYDTSEKSEEE